MRLPIEQLELLLLRCSDHIHRFGQIIILSQHLEVLSPCQSLIADDKGLMHASAAMGMPTLGIFGTTNSKLWAPVGCAAHYLTPPEVSQTMNAVPSKDVINRLTAMF